MGQKQVLVLNLVLEPCEIQHGGPVFISEANLMGDIECHLSPELYHAAQKRGTGKLVMSYFQDQ